MDFSPQSIGLYLLFGLVLYFYLCKLHLQKEVEDLRQEVDYLWEQRAERFREEAEEYEKGDWR
jgi:hypothetical protein